MSNPPRLRRMLRIGVGFLLSAAIVGAVLGLFLFVLASPGNLSGPLDGLLRIVGVSAAMGLVAAAIALIPAGVAIYVAERHAIRTPLYFAAVGAAVPLVLFTPAMLGSSSTASGPWVLVMLLCVVGLAAGLVYWNASGRHSGETGLPEAGGGGQ